MVTGLPSLFYLSRSVNNHFTGRCSTNHISILITMILTLYQNKFIDHFTMLYIVCIQVRE